MNKTSNVIDLKTRRPSQLSAQTSTQTIERGDVKSLSSSGTHAASPTTNLPVSVLDMTTRRQEMLTSERREVKRTILSEFIGAFIVIPQRGLQRVAVYDISEGGVAFDLESSHGQLASGEEVAMRVYMNQHTYFPFIVKISNVRRIPEEDVSRHGCNFMKDTINEVALNHFVKFIENVAASLQTDHGDVMVSNLGGR